MLRVINGGCHIQAQLAECRYAECRYAEFHFADCRCPNDILY